EAFFFGLRVTYCNNSGMSYWVAEGLCVGLAPVAATGLAMPPPYDTLWPGVTWGAGYSNVDMNASNAVAFFDALSGPGIDGTNAMTAWTYGINGFRLLARQGDPSPALNPGETIYSMGFGGGAWPVIADSGAVAFLVMVDTHVIGAPRPMALLLKT